MRYLKFLLLTLFLFSITITYGQLGFCGGSTGEAIFTESFGNGTDYGPPLPAGTTTYPFVYGPPQDSFYTLSSQTNLFSSWHSSLDHSDDATDGPNGKSLIVNANNSTSGEFYKRTVTGLCINTTFEFSAWLLNVYNQSSNVCINNEIPINVRFEIWNAAQTTLLASGDTGDIYSQTTPVWQQKALVFTTVNETTVVLIMKNNGIGGCGNDLAIDDISFKACGDLTTVSNPAFPTNSLTTCDTNATITLTAATNGSSSYYYQWQSSVDNVNWTNIVGENNPSFTSSPVTVTTYYRTRIAQDIANINSPFCSTVSNAFTFTISNGLPPVTSNGDVIACSNQPIPALSVTSAPENSVNWYDQATGGNLLLSNSSSYTPTAAGTFYAESFNALTNCYSTSRTPVTLTLSPLPTGTYSGNLIYCSGDTTAINLLSNAAGTTFSWTVTTTDVSGATNGTGDMITQALTTNDVPGTVIYTVIPSNNGCTGDPFLITVDIATKSIPQIKDGQLCVLGNGTFGIPPYILDTELDNVNNSFEWFLNGNVIVGETNATYSANQLGEYGVIATNLNSGCVSDMVTANVTEFPKMESISVVQSPDFSDTTFITVSVSGGQAPFLYQINDGGFQTSSTFNYLLPGVYEVEVTDEKGCSTLKTTVTIINYPKYFTPNNDGYNDKWTIPNLDENAKIRIFDRYGKFIVELNAKNQSWDGTFNGNTLPSDDYWFTLMYSQKGIIQEYKNHFSLRR